MKKYRIKHGSMIYFCFLLLFCSCSQKRVEITSDHMVKAGLLSKDFGIVLKTELQNVQEAVSTMQGDGAIRDQQQVEMARHAFIMEDGLVFIANIPIDWRYILSPVYEYSYYKDMVRAGAGYQEEACCIKLVGKGRMDGEDNFFEVIVKKGEDHFYYEFPLTSENFAFQDGKKGEWSWQTGEGYFYSCSRGTSIANHYEGIVRDLEGKYSIHLLMLKEEYEANEQKIKKFLNSVCFRDNDLGISRESDILQSELLTLHIWDRYLNLSLQLPEGAVFKKSEYYNADDYPVCSYDIYLGDDYKRGISVISDQGGMVIDPIGDYKYYLNTEDFDDVVYELMEGDYYFPNHHLWIRTWCMEENRDWEGYVRRIIQSVEFE